MASSIVEVDEDELQKSSKIRWKRKLSEILRSRKRDNKSGLNFISSLSLLDRSKKNILVNILHQSGDSSTRVLSPFDGRDVTALADVEPAYMIDVCCVSVDVDRGIMACMAKSGRVGMYIRDDITRQWRKSSLIETKFGLMTLSPLGYIVVAALAEPKNEDDEETEHPTLNQLPAGSSNVYVEEEPDPPQTQMGASLICYKQNGVLKWTKKPSGFKEDQNVSPETRSSTTSDLESKSNEEAHSEMNTKTEENPAELQSPSSICSDNTGKLLLADSFTHRVHVYSPDGDAMLTIPIADDTELPAPTDDQRSETDDNSDVDDLAYLDPLSVTVDSRNNILVAYGDPLNVVTAFTPQGKFIGHLVYVEEPLRICLVDSKSLCVGTSNEEIVMYELNEY